MDDETDLRAIFARFFREKGVEVTEADSAEAAIALLAESGYDAILCDLTLPGLGGREVLLWLKRNRPLNEHEPIAFMSGYSDDELTCPRGCGFIQKPFKLSAVAGIVADMIQVEV